MTALYWIAAVGLSVFAASVTALAVTFLMDTLRGDILDQSINRFWDWCVNGIIAVTYLVIPFYTHGEDALSADIRSWADFWPALNHLAGVEVKWFIYIVLFWLCIIGVIHMSRNSSA